MGILFNILWKTPICRFALNKGSELLKKFQGVWTGYTFRMRLKHQELLTACILDWRIERCMEHKTASKFTSVNAQILLSFQYISVFPGQDLWSLLRQAYVIEVCFDENIIIIFSKRQSFCYFHSHLDNCVIPYLVRFSTKYDYPTSVCYNTSRCEITF